MQLTHLLTILALSTSLLFTTTALPEPARKPQPHTTTTLTRNPYRYRPKTTSTRRYAPIATPAPVRPGAGLGAAGYRPKLVDYSMVSGTCDVDMQECTAHDGGTRGCGVYNHACTATGNSCKFEATNSYQPAECT